MRIGPRYKVKCKCITAVDGHEILWCDTVIYLGVYLTASTIFRCSLLTTTRNALFIEPLTVYLKKLALEEVVMQLLKAYYGLYSYPINKDKLIRSTMQCTVLLGKKSKTTRWTLFWMSVCSRSGKEKKRKVRTKVRDVRNDKAATN